MSSSHPELKNSKKLTEFIQRYSHALSKEEKDKVWNTITTPFIEEIENDHTSKVVTFIYRNNKSEINPINVYLYSAVVPLLAEETKLLNVPNTDIYYLSLVLPATLRTTYSFIILDNIEIKDVNIPADPNFPSPVGKFKKDQMLLSQIFESNSVEIDQRNGNKIAYYVDFELQDKTFGVESILELPSAPKQVYIPTDVQVKEERNKLKSVNRFSDHLLDFSKTNLNSLKEYENQKRKYWIYLPDDYDAMKQYPFILFLDGSDFINTIPMPSILDRMTNQKEIPPTIAVFLDYSAERRQVEYYCDPAFTQFLVKDFIPLLRDKHKLSITHDSSLTTIVGLSASGLAAFYAALIYPNTFGNVITYSASFESKKQSELEELIAKRIKEQCKTKFIILAGSFETHSVQLQFPDGTQQGLSINEANKNVYSILKKHGINADFSEFEGGHNYVCWRGLISEDLKKLYGEYLKHHFSNVNKY